VPLKPDELLRQAREASGVGRDFSESGPPLPPGYEQVTIPVPPQPLPTRFPVGYDLKGIELGMVKLCPRCKGRHGKRSAKLGYIPDPDPRKKDIRCIGCNGSGIVPNVGP
jgi:hypothetical protein